MKDGGLGIKNLKVFNEALLGKWLWRYATDRDSLWRKVVVSKYDEGDLFWLPKDISTSYGVGVWKGIRKGWDVFQRHIEFEIGDGSSVRF